MRFGVIYSVDVPKNKNIGSLSPLKRQPRLWNKTEGNEQYEYDYLEGVWSKGKHGKYCACLTKSQFDAFINNMGLYPEDVETLGSLGCPTPDGQIDLGILPAISFHGDAYVNTDAIQDAYVTPFPEVTGKQTPYSERDFQRIKAVILRRY